VRKKSTLSLVSLVPALDQSRNDAITIATKAGRPGSRYDNSALAPDLVRHGLVDLTGAKARIDKFLHEGLDLPAPSFGQGILHGRSQTEALNALSRPIGVNLTARNAPDLFSVALEEEFVEMLSEAIVIQSSKVSMGDCDLTARTRALA